MENGKKYVTLNQGLQGALAAAENRKLRVPGGMWKRGGGKKGKTASETTHYEAAYRNFERGRTRALKGGYLTSKEQESYWMRFGYYSTLSVIDLLGDTLVEAVAPTPELTVVTSPPPSTKPVSPPSMPSVRPAAAGPKHGEVGHQQKFGDGLIEVLGDAQGQPSSLWIHAGKSKKRGDETVYEKEESVSFGEVPSEHSPEWVRRYWGEVYLGRDYNRADSESLKKRSVYAHILSTMVGDGSEEPSGLPEDVHPRIAQFWRECALGIRDAIEGNGGGEQTPARRAGAAHARENELRGVIEWSEADQRFVWASEAAS